MNDSNPTTPPATPPATPTTTLTLKMYTDEIARLREGTDLKALCKVCNCRYKAITEHIRSKHPDHYLQAKTSGEKLYEKLKIECTFCGFHPSTANSLVNHINSYHIKGNPLINPQAPPATPTATTPVTAPIAVAKTEQVVTVKVPLQVHVEAQEETDGLQVLEPIKSTAVKVIMTEKPINTQITALKKKINLSHPMQPTSEPEKKLTLSLKKPVEDTNSQTKQSITSAMEEKLTPVTNSVTVTSLPTTNGKMNFNINIQLSISQA
jgi:hypothetical protein